MEVLEFHGPGEGRIKEVKVKPGSLLSFGKLILVYQVIDPAVKGNHAPSLVYNLYCGGRLSIFSLLKTSNPIIKGSVRNFV
jgi:hypothetical protein